MLFYSQGVIKKTVKLYPLNPNGKVLEKEFQVIENLSLYASKLMSGKSPIMAVKDCKVKARKVQVGEVVDTRPSFKGVYIGKNN